MKIEKIKNIISAIAAGNISKLQQSVNCQDVLWIKKEGLYYSKSDALPLTEDQFQKHVEVNNISTLFVIPHNGR